MADGEDPSDLFAIPDFWRPSSWLDHPISNVNISIENTTNNSLFAIDVSGSRCLETTQNLIDTGKARVFDGAQDDGDVFFKLPTLLKEFADRELKLPAQPTVDHHEFEVEPLTSSDDEDLWLSSDADPAKPSQHKTWESFEQPELDQDSPLFLSEAGPAAFDALLAAKQATNEMPDVLDAALYCACLLNLALGRSSVLFSWTAEKNLFVKTAPHLRVSGLSLDSISAVDTLCLDCGNSARHLQAFAENTYSAASTPTRIALARVVDRLVAVVRSELSNRSHNVRSILQLQAVVQPAHSVLSYYKRLVKKLAQQKSDEGILSCLFEEAQASEYRSELLRETTREVLRTLSKPWTDFVEEWVGLKAEEGVSMTKAGHGKGFVKVADKMWIDDQGFELEEADYFLDDDKVPAFLPEDVAQTIFETGRNLRFLREHDPEHPLSRPDVVCGAMPPKLEWEFAWDTLSKLEERVNQYRNAVSRAIHGLLPNTQEVAMSPGVKRKYDVAELEYFGKDEAQVEANLVASMQRLSRIPERPKPRDRLGRLLQDGLYRTADAPLASDNLSPHWSLVPLLSFGPVIEAQSSLVSQECMKLLFSTHHLRIHIDLLKQYFLLGNGVLCSRLTHALFDPNLSTAERKAGVALGGGTMGLRLGGRKTWPPASSELRLALMGVLSECYESTGPTTLPTSNSNSNDKLPGDLSFAVRDLSPQEIDRCMDPDSLEALDFLRLSYKPPRALRGVMTPTTLSKYDRVFKLLLRVLRMLYVANELFLSAGTSHRTTNIETNESNASLRLRIEARHFIRQVASYFFDVGVCAHWKKFDEWLDSVEAECTSTSKAGPDGLKEGTGTGAATERNNKNRKAYSPDAVREKQERVLDEIMGVLLLKKRQAPVMGLLKEIFGVVLKFAATARGSRPVEQQVGESDGELYKLFRKKVGVFVTVCKGLGEKMAASSSLQQHSGGNGGGSVEQLLVRLDMAGFYGRGIGA